MTLLGFLLLRWAKGHTGRPEGTAGSQRKGEYRTTPEHGHPPHTELASCTNLLAPIITTNLQAITLRPNMLPSGSRKFTHETARRARPLSYIKPYQTKSIHTQVGCVFPQQTMTNTPFKLPTTIAPIPGFSQVPRGLVRKLPTTNLIRSVPSSEEQYPSVVSVLGCVVEKDLQNKNR